MMRSPDEVIPRLALRRGAKPGLPKAEVIMAAAILAILAFDLCTIAIRLGGHFSYTLDDPYIHLALADRIVQGHYGLNLGEAAAPSSSILFPVLLAGLSVLGLGQFAPLLINTAATLASGLLLCAILRETCPLDRLPAAALALLAGALVLSLNLAGLALTGLEHALHVAVTLGSLYGAIRFLRGGRIAPWWLACAVTAPLIRYEGASLWLACAVLLLVHRRRSEGLLLIGLGAVPIIGFSLFLRSLGLPALPSSILVKSDVAAAGTGGAAGRLLAGLGHGLLENLASADGLRLLLLAAPLGFLLLRPCGDDPAHRRVTREIMAVALFVSAAHVLLGRFGWLSRYEIYCVTLDAAALLFAFGPWLAAHLARATPARTVIAALLPMAFASPYVHRSLEAREAAWSIYAGQFQMHRFATEFYRRPVAVDDLGWVAYGNSSYVLDLWGLGSEAARQARATDPSGRWMDELARRHGVGLAMIYTDWFDHIPAQWQALAKLSYEGPPVFLDRVVTFYATRASDIGPIQAALDDFARHLPAGVTLDRIAPPASQAALP